LEEDEHIFPALEFFQFFWSKKKKERDHYITKQHSQIPFPSSFVAVFATGQLA
jgi:hypothetical protein